jgi:hypothetical protein
MREAKWACRGRACGRATREQAALDCDTTFHRLQRNRRLPVVDALPSTDVATIMLVGKSRTRLVPAPGFVRFAPRAAFRPVRLSRLGMTWLLASNVFKAGSAEGRTGLPFYMPAFLPAGPLPTLCARHLICGCPSANLCLCPRPPVCLNSWPHFLVCARCRT